ncbi:MAG: hypothetical protein H5U29_00005 [Pusillimonas sp.]|nr:hypothetical protein [Pusillimonas sp.]
MTEPIKLPPLPYRSLRILKAHEEKALREWGIAAIEPYRKALHDLIRDLEMRSNLKTGSQEGVVDCGQGVYMQALRALGELDE